MIYGKETPTAARSNLRQWRVRLSEGLCCTILSKELTIYISTMPHLHDLDEQYFVVNRIHDPILTLPYSVMLAA